MLDHIPPVTKAYLTIATIVMVLCTLDILSPFNLYLNWLLITREYQFWRLITCFFFFGNFGLHFFWNAYVLIFYCSSLEEVVFHSRSADFLWMLLTCSCMLLLLSYFFGAGYFFSGAIINVMTYIWGRRNPSTRMSVFFFTVKAPYLPWVLMGTALLIGWRPWDNLMGIIVGHTYYFFEDIFPFMPISKGFKLLKTPKILCKLFKQRTDEYNRQIY
ncbi:DER1-like family protein [Cryptosporidium andersoni]|uniref:Derlin n=1 Tax=Cryptosporidium andersoni TaxID=117008 RepID=A0A1J4MY48_9CRYT|nr:DER1-like family protein [Cryptosporidium andersoni]